VELEEVTALKEQENRQFTRKDWLMWISWRISRKSSLLLSDRRRGRVGKLMKKISVLSLLSLQISKTNLSKN
jgi:hypothetical protein